MKPKFKTQKELQSLDIKELENEKKILNQYTGNLQVLITNYDKSLSLFREGLKELVWLYKKYYIFLENNSRFIEVTKSESSLLIFSKNSVVKKLIIGNSEKSEFLRLYKSNFLEVEIHKFDINLTHKTHYITHFEILQYIWNAHNICNNYM